MNEILKIALDRYGITLQVTTAMEELAELISELNRYFFRENRKDGISPTEAKYALASEIADVEIVCKTLRILIGNDIVDDKIRVKILRLKGRLDNETTNDKTEIKSGSKKGILSTLDDVAQYNYSKSQIKQAYDEGYKAGQEDLQSQSEVDTQKKIPTIHNTIYHIGEIGEK